MIYDPEANIISWEIAEGEISHAWEFNNFIIHLSPNNKPVLIEILDASKFINQVEKLKQLKNIKNFRPSEEEKPITIK